MTNDCHLVVKSMSPEFSFDLLPTLFLGCRLVRFVLPYLFYSCGCAIEIDYFDQVSKRRIVLREIQRMGSVGLPTGLVSHTRKVQSLYKRALRCLESWYDRR